MIRFIELLEIFNLLTVATFSHEQARWLPWWRRYAPVPFAAYAAIAWNATPAGAEGMASTASLVLFIWNDITANRNRRNGDDQEKKDALIAEQRLTDVQEKSFRRETAEAT